MESKMKIETNTILIYNFRHIATKTMANSAAFTLRNENCMAARILCASMQNENHINRTKAVVCAHTANENSKQKKVRVKNQCRK